MHITTEKNGLEIKVSYITNQDKNQSLFFFPYLSMLDLVSAILFSEDTLKP